MAIEFITHDSSGEVTMRLPEPKLFEVISSFAQSQHESITGKIWQNQKSNRKYITISWDAMLGLYEDDIRHFFEDLRQYGKFVIVYNNRTYEHLLLEEEGLEISKVEKSDMIPVFTIYDRQNRQLISVTINCFQTLADDT